VYASYVLRLHDRVSVEVMGRWFNNLCGIPFFPVFGGPAGRSALIFLKQLQSNEMDLPEVNLESPNGLQSCYRHIPSPPLIGPVESESILPIEQLQNFTVKSLIASQRHNKCRSLTGPGKYIAEIIYHVPNFRREGPQAGRRKRHQGSHNS
jgi:hypothetical protein